MSWEPVDLGEARAAAGDASTIGGVELVYPGKRHVFSGPPESAKTSRRTRSRSRRSGAAGTSCSSTSRWGAWDARDRLREMGATDEELERFLYVEPETPASKEIVVELADRWAFSLVIVDAAAGAYALQGLDDNLRARRGDVRAACTCARSGCAASPRSFSTTSQEPEGPRRVRDRLRAQGRRRRRSPRLRDWRCRSPRRRVACTRSRPTRTGWGTCAG